MTCRALFLALLLSATSLAVAQSRPSIILATTTSTQDSGLLDVPVPRVLVGPPDDPAGVRKVTTAADAMRAIASRGVFVSRGDDSGTHKTELALWQQAKIDPRSVARREETGQGMGATLNVADQKRAYTLADRGTFLALEKRLALRVVFAGDPGLRNVYHAYAVNPVKHPRAQRAQARRFIDFLVSPPIQQAIAAFRRDELGQSLFFPDAVSVDGRR